jgi:hypothetical protein
VHGGVTGLGNRAEERGEVTVLVDHDIEGPATLLWDVLAKEGWLALLPIPQTACAGVGLPQDRSDRDVWRFAQDLTSRHRPKAAGGPRMKRDLPAAGSLSFPLRTSSHARGGWC